MESELVRMISMRVPVFTDLGLYLVGSLIICVRLRESSLDCRMADGVDGTAGGRGWSIASGNGERLISGKVDF